MTLEQLRDELRRDFAKQFSVFEAKIDAVEQRLAVKLIALTRK